MKSGAPISFFEGKSAAYIFFGEHPDVRIELIRKVALGVSRKNAAEETPPGAAYRADHTFHIGFPYKYRRCLVGKQQGNIRYDAHREDYRWLPDRKARNSHHSPAR